MVAARSSTLLSEELEKLKKEENLKITESSMKLLRLTQTLKKQVRVTRKQINLCANGQRSHHKLRPSMCE